MKRINILLVFFLVLYSCKGQNGEPIANGETTQAVSSNGFGAHIDTNGSLNAAEMTEKYNTLAISDTLMTKFSARVVEVCQAKGCWMKLELTDGQQAMVRFKDYGFFMPTDIAGKEVVVNGKAFVEEMSLEDQRHYAKDAGRSEAEIAKITAPKKTLGFEADGVLLRQ